MLASPSSGCIALVSKPTDDPNVRVFRAPIRKPNRQVGRVVIREAATERWLGRVDGCRSQFGWPAYSNCVQWPLALFQVYPARTCVSAAEYLWHPESLGAEFPPPAHPSLQWTVATLEAQHSSAAVEPLVWADESGAYLVIYQVRVESRTEAQCRSLVYRILHDGEHIAAVIAEGQERMNEVRRGLFEPKRSRGAKRAAE
jgi:hypothetical protein